jgi:hypothetical protein
MQILDTKIVLNKITDQYKEAKAMGLVLDDVVKYEYKQEIFSIVLSKVVGYSPDKSMSDKIGTPVTSVLVNDDCFLLAIPRDEFHDAMGNYIYTNS